MAEFSWACFDLASQWQDRLRSQRLSSVFFFPCNLRLCLTICEHRGDKGQSFFSVTDGSEFQRKLSVPNCWYGCGKNAQLDFGSKLNVSFQSFDDYSATVHICLPSIISDKENRKQWMNDPLYVLATSSTFEQKHNNLLCLANIVCSSSISLWALACSPFCMC